MRRAATDRLHVELTLFGSAAVGPTIIFIMAIRSVLSWLKFGLLEKLVVDSIHLSRRSLSP